MKGQERLREIKENLSEASHDGMFLPKYLQDMKWLIERVQELEEQASFDEKFYNKKYQRLAEQNQRYKQALEIIANSDGWLIESNPEHYLTVPEAYTECVKEAERALRGESE